MAIGLLLGAADRLAHIEAADLAVFEHQQFDPRVVMHHQRGESPFDIAQDHRRHVGVPGGGDAQVEGAGGARGQGQLRGAQESEGLGTVLAAGVHQHHLEPGDAFKTTGNHQQTLYQQLQGRTLTLGHAFQHPLQHLLINILHGLVVNRAHVQFPDKYRNH